MNEITTNFAGAPLLRPIERQTSDASPLVGALFGCGPLPIGVSVAWFKCADSAPWVRMVWLALSIYGGLKWLTWFRAARSGLVRSVAKSLGYLIAWPGMDAASFFDNSTRPAPPTFGQWCFAGAKTLVGVAIVWKGWQWLATPSPLLAGWVGIGGLLLMLHFGLFHILALIWQRLGVDAKPIVNWPVLASSPSDYWSRRWNLAFRDVAFGIAFRPLARKIGGAAAIMVIFAASGLIHDFVISFPARGGYGLPTIYFLIQGAALCFERSKTATSLGLTKGIRGRMFAGAVVLLPLGLLFHPPFVDRVVLPMLRAMTTG